MAKVNCAMRSESIFNMARAILQRSVLESCGSKTVRSAGDFGTRAGKAISMSQIPRAANSVRPHSRKNRQRRFQNRLCSQLWQQREAAARHVAKMQPMLKCQPVVTSFARGRVMQILVRDLMSRKPVTVDQDTQLDDAMATLIREEVSDVYVTDSAGKLAGVVADYELLKANLIGAPDNLSVSDLMSRQMMTFEPDTDFNTAAGTFRDGRYRRVVVVDDGRPVGQISRGDILRSLAKRVSQRDDDGSVQGVADGPRTATPRKPQNLSAGAALERSSQVSSG